jgi:F0F1-type ATP synthase assembly protein I
MDKSNANKPTGDSGLESSNAEAERIESQANTNAASRAIAVMILMVVPGVAGSYMDKWLGTQFFIVIGFLLGIGIAIFGLLYVARIADLAAKKSRDMRKAAESNSLAGKTKSTDGQ